MLGLPNHDASAAAEVISHGVVRAIDLGRHTGVHGVSLWFAEHQISTFELLRVFR